MKKTIFFLSSLLFLFGAPQTPAQTNTTRTNDILLPNLANLANLANQTNPALTGFPFQLTVIALPERKESYDLAKKARMFLTSKDYDGLDGFLDDLRSSKAAWATGRWKLSDAYAALVPSSSASDGDWLARRNALRRWTEAKPESISARVAQAAFLADYAWKARGSGWASEVTEEGWQLFRDRLDEGMKVLNEAAGLKAKCPVYWTVKMRTALGLQYEKPQFNTIFDEAIHFVPDFEGLYYQRAVYLLPRWYGSEGELESDLAQSADRLGGRDGDQLYAQVVWGLHKGMSSTNVFTENNLSWARVDRGFDVIEKHFPDSLAAINERAHLAALAGDWKKARQYFDQTEGRVDLSIWGSTNEFGRFADWAYRH